MIIILILQEVYGILKRNEIINNADVTNDNNTPYKQMLLVIQKIMEEKMELK